MTKFGAMTHLITNCNHNLSPSLNLEAIGATFLMEMKLGLHLADYLSLGESVALYEPWALTKPWKNT